MKKKFITIMALTMFLGSCGAKDPSSTTTPSPSITPNNSTSSIVSTPTSTPAPQEVNYIKLRESFVQKAKDLFSSINYKGYVKILKDGNSMKFIYLNEAVTGNFVDVKLHYKSLWMDIDNKDNISSEQKPLSSSDPEYIDLNNKINSIFSGKCTEQYSQEILKDIDKYSAYDYFRLTKEGYNVEVIYGGKEYDRSRDIILDKYYKTSYRLNLDKCERLSLSVVENIVRPVYYPSPTPTPSF
ncbi:MAG: hypothetical protein U0457_15800 [Candidatus Sericytochromatia bacterium]